MRVIAAAMAIYALYLPVAWLVHQDYVPRFRPSGRAVEMMLRFEHDKPDKYLARSYVFTVARFPDPADLLVYENTIPMPRSQVWFTPDLGVYVVRIKPSDGSDPRNNGRQYWIVATD